MGADSAATLNNNFLDLLQDESNTKIIRKKAGETVCLIGSAGNARLIQLVEHAVTLPAPDLTEQDAIMRWLVVDVVEAIRSVLKGKGVITTKDGVESIPGMFLFGVHGRLYDIDGSFFVKAIEGDFAAIGSGSHEARGACFAIWKSKIKTDAEAIIRTALEAAERWTSNVRRPFLILHS
jgi:ATP-dependent protease HslVU (ClpYQ) peptidase subunit